MMSQGNSIWTEFNNRQKQEQTNKFLLHPDKTVDISKPLLSLANGAYAKPNLPNFKIKRAKTKQGKRNTSPTLYESTD